MVGGGDGVGGGRGTRDGKRGALVDTHRAIEKVTTRVGWQASLSIDPQI